MGRRRQLIWAAAIAPVAAVLVVIAAWAIDTGMSGGEVMRNVRLAERDVGGLDASDLLEQVESLDESMRDRTVRLEQPAHPYGTTAGEIGHPIAPRLTATSAPPRHLADTPPVCPPT